MPAIFFRNRFASVALSALAVSLVSITAQPEDATTPVLTGIAHAAIRVSDLARSREFYEKLGFEEAFAMDNGGSPTEAFLKIDDRQFLELYPRRDHSQPVGFMHVCFESADLEALNRYYLARGLAPTSVKKAGAGNLLFTMQGPERQNIEYTQYMPGSKHTKDIGMHLGADRISNRIAGLGIEMQDSKSATVFYEERLGFHASRHALEPGFASLDVPGQSGAQVEFVPRVSGSAFRLFFAVPDLGRAAIRLKTLQVFFVKQKSELLVKDPDGNYIILVKTKFL